MENTAHSAEISLGFPTKKRIAVIGGGSWATALVKILSEKDITVKWWLRNKADVQHIRDYHSNPSYLSTIHFDPQRVMPYEDIHEVMKDTDYVLLAVPAAFVSGALEPLTVEEFENKKVISAIKGMIPDRNILITDYVAEKFAVPTKKIAVIGGPCHAEEVAMERQSYLTLASLSKKYAAEVAEMLSCRFIHTTYLKDVYGVEYSAIIKNIIAIACGIARGLNYGDNFQAVLVSNAMQEIKRFLKATYKMKRDLNASAYLGDLLVTTYSQFSRNRTFGNMIGRGYSVKNAQLEMGMVAEGYYAVKCVYELNLATEVRMPITTAVYRILYEKASPVVEFKNLKEQML